MAPHVLYRIRVVITLLLSVAAVVLGYFIVTKLRRMRTIRSMTAVTWLLALSIGLTWFVSMAYLTVVTAQEIFDGLYRESYDFSDYVDRCGRLAEFYDSSYSRYGVQYERPDSLEYGMLDAISMNTGHTVWSGGEYHAYSGSKLIREVKYPMETAVLFYDGEGNLLHSSEEDIMFFSYYYFRTERSEVICAMFCGYRLTAASKTDQIKRIISEFLIRK